MRAWVLLLAGPIVWFVHFVSLYAIASVDALDARAGAAWSRAAIGLATVAALGALACAIAAATRRSDPDALDVFRRALSLSGVCLAAIAVLWQALPALALR